eukprot:2293244-Alexandrium_andersonii.AAC.1
MCPSWPRSRPCERSNSTSICSSTLVHAAGCAPRPTGRRARRLWHVLRTDVCVQVRVSAQRMRSLARSRAN